MRYELAVCETGFSHLLVTSKVKVVETQTFINSTQFLILRP